MNKIQQNIYLLLLYLKNHFTIKLIFPTSKTKIQQQIYAPVYNFIVSKFLHLPTPFLSLPPLFAPVGRGRKSESQWLNLHRPIIRAGWMIFRSVCPRSESEASGGGGGSAEGMEAECISFLLPLVWKIPIAPVATSPRQCGLPKHYHFPIGKIKREREREWAIVQLVASLFSALSSAPRPHCDGSIFHWRSRWKGGGKNNFYVRRYLTINSTRDKTSSAPSLELLPAHPAAHPATHSATHSACLGSIQWGAQMSILFLSALEDLHHDRRPIALSPYLSLFLSLSVPLVPLRENRAKPQKAFDRAEGEIKSSS